jgi:hypothetical protein
VLQTIRPKQLFFVLVPPAPIVPLATANVESVLSKANLAASNYIIESE